MIVTNVIFGFVSAVGGPVLPSIIIEFLGQENLAMGYGFLLIFEGVGSFAGPPLAGNNNTYRLANLVRIRIHAKGISCYLIILLYFWNLLLDDSFVMLRMNVLLCIFLF